MIGVIYKAQSPSGKIYIGKTSKSLERRKNQHYNNAGNRNCPSYNSKFYRALRKHGNQVIWTIEHEEEETQSFLNAIEMFYITWYNSYKKGYNSTLGGEGQLGLRHTKEAKAKITTSQLGKKFSEERKQAIRRNLVGMRGKKHTKNAKRLMASRKKDIPLKQSHKDKISGALTGRCLSDEHRRRISEARKRYWREKTLKVETIQDESSS